MLHYRLTREGQGYIHIPLLAIRKKEAKPQIIEKLVWHKRIFAHIQD